MATFGERLRALRESKGISQERLAEMINYARTNIAGIEAGRRPASDEVLRRIAGIKDLGISFDQLKAWQAIGKMSPSQLAALRKELEEME